MTVKEEILRFPLEHYLYLIFGLRGRISHLARWLCEAVSGMLLCIITTIVYDYLGIVVFS